MDIEMFYQFCESLPGTEATFPFDSKTLVYKVGGKMFALADVEDFSGFNVKCDPEKAEELRAQYPEVTPGFHMNKKHWNTVSVQGSVEESLLLSWIRDSHHLVWSGLSKKQRELIPL
ncbi:MAG: MmcQ/YjbR family DNA-binding protein [Bacteroidetes bacterium]|nr:MAG: MmcQ/YjbR family DNA-binding protein [Bacteroidota bacterium]